MDKLFYALPKKLQDKILPPRKLTPEQKAKEARMTASITPAKYRSARAASEATAALAVPPCTNRGGKSESDNPFDRLPSFEAKEHLKIVPIGKGKFEVIHIPLRDRSKSAKHSFIDYVTFTFKATDMPLTLQTGHQAISDYDYVMCLSAQLYGVFGFGVTEQRPNGLNGYRNSFELGYHGWGVVCIGGQNDSVMVTVKGQGLMAAKPGWESRLYRYLGTIHKARITRVDLASDNFNSETTLNDYLDMYRVDLFTSRGRAPNVECAGNWERPNGKGRTLYVGSRTSGKLLRIYEKGLQLANGFHEKYPNWVRVELELSNKDRVIPFETLLYPGQYLAGAYPALANMHRKQERIETAKKTVKTTVRRSLETTRHQFGKHIWTHAQLFGIEKTFELLTHGKEELPKTLNFDTFEQFDASDYLHSIKPLTYPMGAIPL